jgi:hypothetical protein
MIRPAGTTFSTVSIHVCVVPAGRMVYVMSGQWIHVDVVPAEHMVYVLLGWYHPSAHLNVTSGRYRLLDHVDPCMHGTGRANGNVMSGRYHDLDHLDPHIRRTGRT